MRLRNRIRKATYWTDGTLLRWHRDKREFYASLWAMAEDSCCLVDDPFDWKVSAWPSPLDTEMSVEAFETWRDELIEDGKLIPYTVDGIRYLYIPDMANHETMRNPLRPDLPLPPWVEWVQNDRDSRKGSYEHNKPLYDACTSVPVPTCTGLDTSVIKPPVETVDCVDNSESPEKIREMIRESIGSGGR